MGQRKMILMGGIKAVIQESCSELFCWEDTEAVVRRCSSKLLGPATLLKRGSNAGFLPVNIPKFLRAPLFIELLRQLLLKPNI